MIEKLQNKMHTDIPLTKAMGVTVEDYQSQQLILSAPLAPNINHRKSAFGGSIASLATLACWGLLWAELKHQKITARLVIQSGSTQYFKPIQSTFQAICCIDDNAAYKKFSLQLERNDLARIKLSAQVISDDTIVAEFTGQFVAKRVEK